MAIDEAQEREWARHKQECYDRWLESTVLRATKKALSLGRKRRADFYEHLRNNYSEKILSMVAKRVQQERL